ncbi:acetyl/propionyl/methylcrotonyl-CoA carboxylase subunit alpha [Sinorhizobium meliloti]|uniref:acetyl/propionyl/methylcrotonyl-CoA carboxylase subunit alpha n=1 Tax=Rhizobium meliloti TaxID=382 RepID=UPI0001E4B17B|nr:biotin carboxylase N-terminal domain-containing protein [Sinorhizobium meliloti]AEG58069.1 Pyruvate carboxylase [Sinorhizobium meliloti AK83]MDE4589040.1 ATP-grasp domain-containing protein [Sinorhizobium meliloti]SEJ81358.1 acetyl-CoA/propionyl-CoA carboxylase, biotin carboxylase, biotin carboxyl carrier protein [Sinorhizobium meliloti]
MKKLLIANRGEIAIRIARAARDYGVVSVAIYADADAGSLHAELADEAFGLGPGRPADTYLNIPKILDIARRAGADAVHPGYGFLSERAEFAQAAIDAGLMWVGPAPAVITALGDKVEARRIAAHVGAPLVKGSDGPLASAADAVAFAREAGLPLAIKAAFGGGGRGMKVARRLEEVGELFDSAVREATEAFGRGECYAEQFLDKPRHVEAQILADRHGNTVVLGTRDCSLQRRNQKLVEEAPAPFISEDQRARIHDAARAICAEAGYTGAGTVEFLLSRDGVISFLEVNTRLQVEHPVTEETTGLDIVIEQLRIADGLPLSVRETPSPRGHAFEFRINAEDPGRGFLPTPGRITRFRPPSGPGVRLDAGVETGSVIPGLYDSMMAKLIVTGATREDALIRARRALAEFQIEGVASVLPFHRAVLEERDFTGEDGFRVYTNWIETAFRGVAPAPRVDRVEGRLVRSFIEFDGKRHALGLPASLFYGLSAPQPVAAVTAPASDGAVTAPIPGILQQWLVEDEATVAEGEAVALIEAMKMETRILAHKAGRIRIKAVAGNVVGLGAELATID